MVSAPRPLLLFLAVLAGSVPANAIREPSADESAAILASGRGDWSSPAVGGANLPDTCFVLSIAEADPRFALFRPRYEDAGCGIKRGSRDLVWVLENRPTGWTTDFLGSQGVCDNGGDVGAPPDRAVAYRELLSGVCNAYLTRPVGLKLAFANDHLDLGKPIFTTVYGSNSLRLAYRCDRTCSVSRVRATLIVGTTRIALPERRSPRTGAGFGDWTVIDIFIPETPNRRAVALLDKRKTPMRLVATVDAKAGAMPARVTATTGVTVRRVAPKSVG
jgi:hypothetical protein